MLNTFALALAIAGGLSCIWIWLWLREDRENPEPISRIIIAFIGGFIAVLLSIIGGLLTYHYINPETVLALYITAFTEEALKFLMAGVTSLRTKFVDEPIDIIIYCVITAIGFATFENALFLLPSLSEELHNEAFYVSITRFIGPTLLHISSTGIIGILLAWQMFRSKPITPLIIGIGIFGATLFHFLYNVILINYSHTTVIPIITFVVVWGTMGILMLLSETVKPEPTQH
jgi:RsiW-degrading membrane proteinase PrsW (M82 family)